MSSTPKSTSTSKAVVLGYDRIALMLDSAAPKLPINALKKHCNNIEVLENKSSQYQSIWQSRIDIFQPDKECLSKLNDYISAGSYRICMRYVEISCDFITANFNESEVILKFILEHLNISGIKIGTLVEPYEDTYYLNRRTNVNGDKAPKNVVLYADKPSKLASKWIGKPCCHLEYRLTGSDIIGFYGISSIADVLLFDHMSFWHTNLHFLKLPFKNEIGHYLSQGQNISGTALTNKANKFLRQFYVGDYFVLQNMLQTHPEMKEMMRPMSIRLLSKQAAMGKGGGGIRAFLLMIYNKQNI